MSPITLLEFGLATQLTDVADVIVCCPEGFWRKGNIEIMCNFYNIPLYTDKESFFKRIIERVNLT